MPLLEYRLRLIRRLLAPSFGGVLLEIGCGTGMHLFSVADAYRRAIGTDISPRTIAVAEAARRTHPCAARVELYAEPAERLASVPDETADAVLCVGALEHMPDKPAVLAEARRVLKPGGRFVCLTPNGDYLWYRCIAPWLGLEVRHLTSDRFVNGAEMRRLLEGARLHAVESGYWRFIARGDMPPWAARTMAVLDRVGAAFRPSLLCGGLYVCALRDPRLDSRQRPGPQLQGS
jgi:2-polyprenyl-6-hydroxyphenyl methylase/3-demethylubiquinone-9 3-methyltransferase